jgi:hypothetical protein
MYKNNDNGDKGLASRKFNFKYVETTWIDGREISNTEKTWTADDLADYNRFRDLWQELETFDEGYRLSEIGCLADGEPVCMGLEYKMTTDYGETINFIRGISYKIAE